MFSKSNKFNKLYEILELDRPLVIFNVETTGPNISTDKIIEMTYVKIWKNGVVKKENLLINPEIEISQEAFTIHGIGKKEVGDKPKFRDKAQEMWEIFNDCYYGGYNIMKFDLPILRREFIRVGLDFEYSNNRIIDSKEIFHYMEPKNLSAAYEHYCKKEIKSGRKAQNDAEVAADVLVSQVEKHKELLSQEFISKIYESDVDSYRDNTRKFYWYHGETFFAFSKYKDKPLSEVVNKDLSFLEWILKSNFSNETKNIIRTAIKKYYKNIKS